MNGPPVKGTQRVSVGRVGSMYTVMNAATERITLHRAMVRSMSFDRLWLMQILHADPC